MEKLEKSERRPIRRRGLALLGSLVAVSVFGCGKVEVAGSAAIDLCENDAVFRTQGTTEPVENVDTLRENVTQKVNKLYKRTKANNNYINLDWKINGDVSYLKIEEFEIEEKTTSTNFSIGFHDVNGPHDDTLRFQIKDDGGISAENIGAGIIACSKGDALYPTTAVARIDQAVKKTAALRVPGEG